MSLRIRLGNSLLTLVRAYTSRFPIDKGKFRLMTLAMRLSPQLPPPVTIKTKDGCLIRADLRTGMHDFVYFLGDYEPSISDIARTLVDPGNICVDAGANFGWYSLLFHKLAGHGGEVHAFEPVPSTFDELKENFVLAGSPPNLYLNRVALTETSGELTINLFEGMPSGHASLSDQGRSDAISFECTAWPLNKYLAENHVGEVDFVKVDIEGAELGFLKGATTLLTQASPPIIIMEMALNQTRNFGYLPNELIKFIAAHADYTFYKIIEADRRLIKIDGFAGDDIGANVLCVPASRKESLERIRKWLG